MITNLRESKARLSELVERAVGGETVLITVRGKPKAKLSGLVDPALVPLDNTTWVRKLAALQSQCSTAQPSEDCAILDDLRGERW